MVGGGKRLGECVEERGEESNRRLKGAGRGVEGIEKGGGGDKDVLEGYGDIAERKGCNGRGGEVERGRK